ncbi:hypothetical protein A1O3_05086 [Capronia epimyces CBS 606.96]|uniref:Heterokaryon incompatibility domain-containing protein n=1 Tax=Capronia epimyces CBS 606.96 TaxID=1182542 RepID=W9YQ92_9EURO|nr:uncharacterized protein A1O3_05086 [Capronia epimyces CBS 606.96]EXJ84419.1 hypothetical protein A1O3_05086 [Capronia epimyces CBS 606.96]
MDPHTCAYCQQLTLRLDEPNDHGPFEREIECPDFTARKAIDAAAGGCSLCNWLLYPGDLDWLGDKGPQAYKLYVKYNIPQNENGGGHVEIKEFGFRKHKDAPKWCKPCRLVVYADSDQSIPTAIPGERSIELARQWLQDCKTQELQDCKIQELQDCKIKENGNRAPKIMPRRVVEIHQDNSGNWRLNLSVDMKNVEDYAALSYSWGGEQLFKTEQKNLHERQKQINFCELPKTIQDAIRVTWGLKIHYLWVDSLCILQDEGEDQKNEFLQQAEIYSGAQVTIAASKSQNHREGFLDELIFKVPSGTSSWLLLLKLNAPNQPEPLFTRGWTFQEYHLSRRILSYESYQLRFANDLGFNRNENWYVNLPAPHGENRHGPPGRGNHLNGQSNEDAIREWYGYVQRYSLRQLTNMVDKIPAIMGLGVRYYGVLQRLPFASGIWLRTRETERPQGDSLPPGLAAGLLWKLQRPSSRKFSKPSWSWASVDGDIDVSSILEYLDTEPDIEITDFQEYKSRIKGRVFKRISSELFARIASETVRLQGHALPAVLVLQRQNSASTFEVRINDNQPVTLTGPQLHLDTNLGLDTIRVQPVEYSWGPARTHLVTLNDAPSLQIPVTLLRLYPQTIRTDKTESIIGLILLPPEDLEHNPHGWYIRIGVFEASRSQNATQESSNNPDQGQEGGNWQLLNAKFNESNLASIAIS